MKSPAQKRMRILLFEDNNMLRSTLNRLMREHRWEVIGYPDPEGCPLRFAEKCTCNRGRVCADVIVTDLQMPHVDGFTFVHDLLEVGCKVPFLAMFTACEDAERLERAKSLGFAVFSKYDGLPTLLEWLIKVERQVDTNRFLTSRALLFKH
jgi:CheY-like chemotaxis protein